MVKTITQSLLDRLIDDNPEQAIDPAESEEEALFHYKAGLRRDLEALLNGKRPQIAALDRNPLLARSMVGFGLHDISTEDFSAAGARDRIRRMMAQCIREHEPRLSDVEVEMDEGATSEGVRFRIVAVLKLTRDRDMVVYDASVRPSDRAIAVALGRER